MGGATEAAIWSNQHVLPSDGSVPAGWSSIPYGIPLRNQTMYILEEPSLLHAAPWAIGVIYIGGVGVASGYHNDQEKTRAQFITHPQTGEQLFRTGDLGRVSAGLIEICGREDAQVKLNGFRVELGEVEHTLLGPLNGDGAHARVVAAAASVQLGHLCAHVVLVRDGDDSTKRAEINFDGESWAACCSELRSKCIARLPQYMVPAHIEHLAVLPLSANGKLQRDKLPMPTDLADRQHPSGQKGTGGNSKAKVHRLPANACERTVRSVMADILSVLPDAICCDEGDFFQLGGSSVTALRLLLALRDCPDLAQTGGKGWGGTLLTVRDLVAGATVAKLAELLLSKSKASQSASLALHPPTLGKSSSVQRRLELLPLQPGTARGTTPILLFNPAGASCLCYMDLVRAFSLEGIDGPVIGIDDGCITRDDGTLHFASIKEVAEAAVPLVLEAAASAGEVVLGGWSYGGVVALEVAKALIRREGTGVPKALCLLLFDAPLEGAVVSGPLVVEEFVRSVGAAASLHFSLATTLLQRYHANDGALQDVQALKCGVLDVHAQLSDDLSPRDLRAFDWVAAGVTASTCSVSAPGTHWTMLSQSGGAKVVAAETKSWMQVAGVLKE